MMTDSCGLSNSGSYSTAPAMIPSIGFTATFTPNYTTLLGNSTGKAIWYPGLLNYVSMTPVFDFKLNFTNSFSFFAYFVTNSSQAKFALLEIGTFSNGLYLCGKQMWIVGDNIFANFREYKNFILYNI